ncbi:MAG: hypothetical protein H6631_08990 [Anaerolineaceae bacterium]|nr:hypothetical protein [Anaerolineaceae bacterium]
MDMCFVEAAIDGPGQKITKPSWLWSTPKVRPDGVARRYQTQARYRFRLWEPGDRVRDEGWLPVVGLPTGNYEKADLRCSARPGPLVEWQTLRMAAHWIHLAGQHGDGLAKRS